MRPRGKGVEVRRDDDLEARAWHRTGMVNWKGLGRPNDGEEERRCNHLFFLAKLEVAGMFPIRLGKGRTTRNACMPRGKEAKIP